MQSLSSENAAICNKAGPLLAAVNTGIVVAIIMIVVGIALTISGVLLRKTETTKTEQYEIPSTQPCKSCGKSIKWNQAVEGPDIWHKGCYPKTVKS
jgi:hypothetical protein